MQNEDALILLSKKITFDQNSPSVLAQALRIAIYDEYRALETYKAIIAIYGAKAPFVNLMQAEIKHYEELSLLAQKHGIEIPINDVAPNIQVPKSLQECYELGVATEIENIYLYDYLLPFVSEYPDIQDAFFRLQAASINNHLPTLRNHVANPQNINQEEIMSKINDFGAMANKIASGEANPQEIANLFSQTNISLITGLLVGSVGSVALNNFFENKEK